MLFEQDETADKTQWVFRAYLNAEAIDLRHTKVSIPFGYLLKPGSLTVWSLMTHTVEMDAEALSKLSPEQELYVASKDSPVISSVEPSSVRADAGKKDDVPVTLRGSGFTQESLAVFGTRVHRWNLGLSGWRRRVRVTRRNYRRYIPSYLLTLYGPFAGNEPIRVWVTDDNTRESFRAA